MDIVASVADDANFEARPLGKSVKMTGDGSCMVDGNEALLRSAVENVLRNAVRYTKEGTAVEVSVIPNGEKVKVKISDHGGGVPEAELKNLFKPFYRVGEARVALDRRYRTRPRNCGPCDRRTRRNDQQGMSAMASRSRST